ncbi:hypothetical protein [Candidatus Hodgkinia cicadicola]|uniref:hypothetical protein n=1 Tax=Candidatus Hodgkinia cicadicola TaxID=573658 RepID=UPI0011BAE052
MTNLTNVSSNMDNYGQQVRIENSKTERNTWWSKNRLPVVVNLKSWLKHKDQSIPLLVCWYLNKTYQSCQRPTSLFRNTETTNVATKWWQVHLNSQPVIQPEWQRWTTKVVIISSEVIISVD